MTRMDLNDDLMDELFSDRPIGPLVITLDAQSDDIARIERQGFREIKTATGRPSNDHPRSPRRRK